MNPFKTLLNTRKKLFTSSLLVIALITLAAIPNHTFGAQQGGARSVIAGSVNDMPQPHFGCFDTIFTTNNIPSCLAAGAYYLFLMPIYMASGWVSMVFNIVVLQLVIGMGNFVRGLTGVMEAWILLRDLTNILLVFITIYIGIATILGISGYGYKKLLWRVLLAALLVNFSATFSKGIIDVSNIFAIETYRMLVGPSANDCLGQTQQQIQMDNNNQCLTHGVASVFWTQLKLTTVFDIRAFANLSTSSAPDILWKMFFTAIMVGILFLVLAFVVGGAAFLLIARFVILVFLIIVSPIALMFWITGLSSQGSKWWTTLLNQSMFAPLLLLMWWMALRMTGSFSSSMMNQSLSDVGNFAQISSWSIFMYCIIIMGFLLAGLILAKQMGAYGAGAVLKIGNTAARGAVGAIAGGAVGVTAYSARQTVGRAGAKLNETEHLKNAAASENFLKRQYGRLGLATSKSIAGSSFDARTLTKSKALGSAGGKGGFNTWAENKAKKEENLNKHLSTYKGNYAERSDERKALGAVDTEYDKKVSESQKTVNDHTPKLVEAAKEVEVATTNEQRVAAETKLAEVRAEAKRLKDEHNVRVEEFNEQRLQERNDIAKRTADTYAEKGKARSERNLDRLSTEKTFVILPTPQWKRDVVTKIRSSGSNKEKMKKVREILNEIDAPEPVEPNPAPNNA